MRWVLLPLYCADENTLLGEVKSCVQAPWIAGGGASVLCVLIPPLPLEVLWGILQDVDPRGFS